MRFPADSERNIRGLVATGRFKDETEVMREALRLLDVREQRIIDLRASIQEGLAAIEGGEGIELTDEVWERLERDAEERTEAGIPPKLDVCP